VAYPGALAHRDALTAAIALSFAIGAVIALPVLPERDLQGSVVMALNPAQGEMVGWPRFVDTVANAWDRLTAEQRAHTAIFTANYGEAAVIDLFGRPHGLPRSYSGHNGFSEWGMPPAADTNVLLLGFDPTDVAPYFSDCRTLARINNDVGLDNNEQGLPVMLCSPTNTWAALWPRLRHYN